MSEGRPPFWRLRLAAVSVELTVHSCDPLEKAGVLSGLLLVNIPNDQRQLRSAETIAAARTNAVQTDVAV